MSEGSTEGASSAINGVAKGLGFGTVFSGVADWLEGNGLDKADAAAQEIANALTGGEAADAAGMLVPYLMDLTGAVL